MAQCGQLRGANRRKEAAFRCPATPWRQRLPGESPTAPIDRRPARPKLPWAPSAGWPRGPRSCVKEAVSGATGIAVQRSAPESADGPNRRLGPHGLFAAEAIGPTRKPSNIIGRFDLQSGVAFGPASGPKRRDLCIFDLGMNSPFGTRSLHRQRRAIAVRLAFIAATTKLCARSSVAHAAIPYQVNASDEAPLRRFLEAHFMSIFAL